MNTLFLSQLMGPVMAVIGLAMLIRQKDMKKLIKNMIDNPLTLFINGIVELAAGISIVLYHNLWNTLAAVIITTIGWLMIMEGAFGVLASKGNIKKITHSFNLGTLNPFGLIVLVLAGFLVWNGYFAFLI